MSSRTLSFCIYTRGPADRIHAMLSLFRPVADEIVLAVDNTEGGETLEACAGLADRRFELESARFGYHHGWLLNQCSGDWVLRFDEDEVPSTALLEALPSLLEDRFATNILISRRWLYPDTASYIANHPWTPDYQVRLLRNVPGIWRTTGTIHDNVEVWGEQKLVDLPMYHWTCALDPLSERRAKRERYEQERPALETDGFPVNAMHTPEDCSAVKTAPVPDADRALVEGVIQGSEPSSHGALSPRSPVRSVPLRESSRFAEIREVSPAAYRARLRFVGPWHEMPAGGAVRGFEMLAENLGDELWPWGAHTNPPIRLGYVWLDAESREPVMEGRTPFGESVRPGQTTRLFLGVASPPRPGRYVLKVDVVHDFVRWFDCAIEVEVSVTEGVRSRRFARLWPRRFHRLPASAKALSREYHR